MNVQTVELNFEKIKFSQFFSQKHFSVDHLHQPHQRQCLQEQILRVPHLRHQNRNQNHQRKLHRRRDLINQHQHHQFKCEIPKILLLVQMVVWQDQEVLLIRLKVKIKERMFHFIHIQFLTIHQRIKMEEIPVIHLKEMVITGISKVVMCFRLIIGKLWIPYHKFLGWFSKIPL